MLAVQLPEEVLPVSNCLVDYATAVWPSVLTFILRLNGIAQASAEHLREHSDWRVEC